MARTNMNLPDDIDREMRHEAVDLGLRYPGEFVQHLWKQYKKYNEEGLSMTKFLKELNDCIFSAKTIRNGIGEDVTPEVAIRICRKAHREGRLSGEIGRRVRVASNDPYEQLDIIF